MERVVLGKFGRPHGVKGELRLYPLNEDSDVWGDGFEGLVELDGEERLITLESFRWAERFAIVRVEGVRSREQAQLLTNVEVYVPRSALPEPEDGAFYLFDLVGLPVYVEGIDVPIGAVAGIMDAGAHDILVVPHAHGTKRTLVPIVDHALRAMDPSDGRITLAPLEEWAPEGLADDIPGWSGGDDE